MRTSNFKVTKAVLVLLLLSSRSLPPCLAEGGTGAAIAKGLSDVIPLIVRAFGNAEITAVPVGYKYSQKTTYRGVTGLTSYELSVDAVGNPKYTRMSEMTGVDNPATITSAAPFTISMGGLPGDVPFAIRKHKCEMSMGDGSVFLVTTDAKITYKVYHKYTANPVRACLKSRCEI